MPLPSTTTTIICDIAAGSSHPFFPAYFWLQVYNSLHSLSHPGIRATQQLITLCFVKDVRMWVRAIPISDITAETVAQAFICSWIARFGTPSTISTDRGRQPESELFTHFMQLLGTKCICTTTYPFANGLVERLHSQLMASLKAQLDPTNWTDSLPMVLLGIRITVKEDISLHCCRARV